MVYFSIIMVVYFSIIIYTVYPENQIKQKLLQLLDSSADIPYARLGFTRDSRKEPIWR